jgi:erythromycin esterase
MKKLFILLLFPLISFGQTKLKPIDLSDSGNVMVPSYLASLDSIFQNTRLIGLGEATHGTSEFTVIRAELFKYLVEKHGYTVFFLEADYNACARVNRYIHGEKDELKEAVLEIQLWPWLTEELVDLIEWMRSYNQGNSNTLKFIGCDMQLIKDDVKELPRLLSGNEKYKQIATILPDLKFDPSDSTVLASKQMEWLKFSDTFLQSFPEEEPLIITTVNQWFESFYSTNYKNNFRDSCMGNNIADYLLRNPSEKGIYFAHNAHVGKISYKFKGSEHTSNRAGHYLGQRLNNQYLAIGLEFNVGTFNAINYVDEEFVMEYFTIKKNHRRSLPHVVMGKDDKIKFVFSSSLDFKQHLKMNSIGAIYGRNKNGNKIYRYRSIKAEQFDGFIIINQGTHSNLLTLTPRKSKSRIW